MAADDDRRARTYLDRTLETPETVAFVSGIAAVFTAKAPGEKPVNEDSAAVLPAGEDSGVLAVADGLGGLPGGDRASALAIESLRDSLGAADGRSPLRSAILDGIEHANRRILDLGIGAGTTLAVLEIQGTTVRPYHAGDSMVFVTGQRGRIKLKTISHSPVGHAVESGMMEEEDAVHHEDRHVVSNILGAADMRIEIGSPVELAVRDTVVLGSDGLFDNFYFEELVEHVRKNPLPEIARRLAQEGMRRMTEAPEGNPSKPDDFTFIVFRRRRKTP